MSAQRGTVRAMSDNSAQFLANADRFTLIVSGVPDWDAPSACTDWTAAQALDHVIDTQRGLFQQHGRDLGQRAAGTPEELWLVHRAAIEPHVLDEDWLATAYDGWFGPTTVGETLSTFYGFDLLVHGWDIASASDERYDWTQAEMDQVETAMAGFGAALYTEGVCKAAVEVPGDASRQVKLLGLLGRAA